jgi:ABC-type polysaccharide/polyol phosphate transport system ATPase subunit
MASVVLQNVRVDFPIYGAQRSLRTAIFQRATGGLIHREGKNQGRVVVRALNDVSLQLREGDRLGLIGHNGSGKSTLLKVLAGIYEPIAGKLLVDGRVTPLFDMMPGLDVEDTGYENIFTAGMLLGISRDELERRIPEIEEFCELGEYLALPVRTYSAGMTMRLGFAIVTALDPGILLMDEGFGTGDLRFTERAADRMNDFIGRSRIIVLASHSDAMIKSMCNKAALMQEGRILAVGPVGEVLEEYQALVHRLRLQAGTSPSASVRGAALADAAEDKPEQPVYSEDSISDVGLVDRLARTSGAVRFTKAVARDISGQSRWSFVPGETAVFHFEYEVLSRVQDLAFYFRLYLEGGGIWQVVTETKHVVSTNQIEEGERGGIVVTLPNMKLMPHEFSLYGCLAPVRGRPSFDVIDTNVALPKVVIRPQFPQQPDYCLVSIDCEIRDIDLEPHVGAALTTLRLGVAT